MEREPVDVAQQDIDDSNYELWQPVCRRSGSVVNCSFDVTSEDGCGINSGSADLFAGFLKDLDVCFGKVGGWSIRRFATPFYSYDPEEEDWRSLFGLAWRIELSVTDVTRYRACGKVGPYSGRGLDPTWVDGQGFAAGEEEDCVIIASEGPIRDFSFLTGSTLGGELELVENEFPLMTVFQGRLNLGVVNLPESAEAVRGILNHAKAHFATTHWSDAFERSAWQKPAEWTPLG